MVHINPCSGDSNTAPLNENLAVTDFSNHGTSSDTKAVTSQAFVLRSSVSGAQSTSQGKLDTEHAPFPVNNDKRTLGECTTFKRNNIPKRKHDDNLESVANNHQQPSRSNDLTLTTNFCGHLSKIVELQSGSRGKLVRTKITANRRPRSMAVLFPALSSTITLPPVLFGASTSYQHGDSSIRQHGTNNPPDTFGGSRNLGAHGQAIDEINAAQLNRRQCFTQDTRELGNHPMTNAGKHAHSPKQLRQAAQVGLPNQQQPFQQRRSTELVTNRNGTNRQSGPTTAVPPPFAPPTRILKESRPGKSYNLPLRFEPRRLPDQGVPSIIGCREPSGQAIRPERSQHFQPHPQAQTASPPRQLLQPRLHQQPHESEQPGRHGRHYQPQQVKQAAASSAPEVLPAVSSKHHHGQNRSNIRFAEADVQELDADNSYFAAAYSEFLVAKAFEYGAARYTFEQHHTTPKLIGHLECAYLRFLAAKYPQESDYYLRVALSLRRDREEPTNHGNGGISAGHDNGGSSRGNDEEGLTRAGNGQRH